MHKPCRIIAAVLAVSYAFIAPEAIAEQSVITVRFEHSSTLINDAVGQANLTQFEASIEEELLKLLGRYFPYWRFETGTASINEIRFIFRNPGSTRHVRADLVLERAGALIKKYNTRVFGPENLIALCGESRPLDCRLSPVQVGYVKEDVLLALEDKIFDRNRDELTAILKNEIPVASSAHLTLNPAGNPTLALPLPVDVFSLIKFSQFTIRFKTARDFTPPTQGKLVTIGTGATATYPLANGINVPGIEVVVWEQVTAFTRQCLRNPNHQQEETLKNSEMLDVYLELLITTGNTEDYVQC